MSENTHANLIVRLQEQFSVDEELSGSSCGMENKNVAINKDTALKNDASKSESAEPNTEKPVIDEAKCDICNTVDVENLTNNLAEKVNIKVEANDKCDMESDETDKEQGVVEVVNGTATTIVNKIINTDSKPGNLSLNKSTVILKLETDSLRNLLEYDSSSNDEAETEAEPNWQFRTINQSDSDSDDSLSSEEDDDDENDDDEDDIRCPIKKQYKINRSKAESPFTEDFTLKIYAENNIHDLPPIRDVSNLDIDLEREEFLHMGHIEAVIETLITVEAIPGTPAYDLDTCLFVEDTTLKRPLGAIYDVLGPVASPLYCIRFQYSTDIENLNLKKGMKVFCAPKSQYTKYVFVRELMKHKGTDASWVGDKEIPPEIAAQMSDDECPVEHEEVRKAQKRKHTSQERHRRFEEDMNRCNSLNSHAARLVDAQQRHTGPRISRYGDHVQRVLFGDASGRLAPSFDPTVPPPGFHSFLGRNRGPMEHWSRPAAVAPSRPVRCQGQGQFPSTFASNGQNPNSFFNGYASSDTGHGAGTSSHPY